MKAPLPPPGVGQVLEIRVGGTPAQQQNFHQGQLLFPWLQLAAQGGALEHAPGPAFGLAVPSDLLVKGPVSQKGHQGHGRNNVAVAGTGISTTVIATFIGGGLVVVVDIDVVVVHFNDRPRIGRRLSLDRTRTRICCANRVYV